MKRRILTFNKKPCIKAVSAVAGKKEMDGPLSEYFDFTFEDTKLSEKTWEKAESELIRVSFDTCLKKSDNKPQDIDILFAGDLINQCTVSTFGLIENNIPYFGIYGACSTYVEGLILSATMIESDFAKLSASVCSSHFCTAERQYRFPIEYGCQRTPSSQNTVTGAGAVILSSCSDDGEVYVSQALAGIACDMGISDVNNMGAAMAPAAVDTFKRYFVLSGMNPSDFDLILTGDLGVEGHGLFMELLKKDGFGTGDNIKDCGMMIYNIKEQDMHSGGSGCGCSAIVTNGYIMSLFANNKINDILLIGTGALLSPLSSMQGNSIPGIAHLVRLTKK